MIKWNLLKKLFNKALFLFYILGICVFVWIIMQIFCFTSFKIPSDSMEPEITSGDDIVVNKMLYGARIFNVFDALNGKDVVIHRVPGIDRIRRNDVIVFNFPYPNTREKISFDIMKYYMKRCIAIPGDTFEIKNAHYRVRGVNEVLGNIESQSLLFSAFIKGHEETLYKVVVKGYPHDSIVNWTVENFGPLYVPRKGDRIPMNKLNYVLYKELIEWEQKKKLRQENDKYYLEDELITEYQFDNNYYFVAGDKVMNSRDSRYWGLLPEEFIVGKAVLIWKSIDPWSEEVRWERMLKKIN